ncbi:hypothetical protein BGZ99_006092 [Dissophora globulifera]|uniref:Uncharacterized protein n=1 Tax=Dissophora globulifera TaxID=979702 RepID=A0A9P6URN0_9FUNG|nr:hypothetical protein BGZ99_006092 [Dissophora globulifera]
MFAKASNFIASLVVLTVACMTVEADVTYPQWAICERWIFDKNINQWRDDTPNSTWLVCQDANIHNVKGDKIGTFSGNTCRLNYWSAYASFGEKCKGIWKNNDGVVIKETGFNGNPVSWH